MTKEEIRHIVHETVQQTLTSIGLDTTDGEAIKRAQRNMLWLDSRVALEERVSGRVIVAVAVAAVGGVLSLIAAGVKTLSGH